MKVKYILSLVVLLMLLSSCKMLFKKPELQKILDLQLVSFSPDRSELKLSLMIKNPNKYSIRLSSLKLDLLDKNRNKVGESQLDKYLDLPGKKSTNLDLKVTLNTRPLVKSVSNLNKDVQFFISAKGEAKAMGIGKKFSFEEPYSVSLKEHLEKALGGMKGSGQDFFKLTRTYLDEVGLSKSSLNADFILMNPYGFSFNLKGFPAKIYIDDKEVGSGQLKSQMSFNEHIFYKDGTMIFELSNLKSVLGAAKGVVKGEIAYTVKGTVIIDALGMTIREPYQFSGKIPVSIWDLLLKQL